MDVEIPANTNATVFIPASSVEAITESGKLVQKQTDIKMEGDEKGYVKLNVGSGVYHFVVKEKKE